MDVEITNYSLLDFDYFYIPGRYNLLKSGCLKKGPRTKVQQGIGIDNFREKKKFLGAAMLVEKKDHSVGRKCFSFTKWYK